MLLGGDKGVGKTSLALQAILAALGHQKDLGAVIYSLDMPKTRIYQRLLCLEAGCGVCRRSGAPSSRCDCR